MQLIDVEHLHQWLTYYYLQEVKSLISSNIHLIAFFQILTSNFI